MSWPDAQVDDRRRLVRGAVTVYADGAIVVVLPHRLRSPNTATLGAHWRVKHREKRAWVARLRGALADAAAQQRRADRGAGLVIASLTNPLAGLGLPAVLGRRRVRIIREVPSRRNFIRDDDNLAFAGKHLTDALKQVGLIRDDSRAFCELERPTQTVSADGRDRTIVRVEIPEGETIPLRERPAAE